MATEIIKTEIYHQVNGVNVLKETIESQVEVPTQQELIAQKEAELLAMYQELENLKNKQ